ncbi:MAG: hypothetical protein R2695_16145 [Acidimicrobiales bacterium]
MLLIATVTGLVLLLLLKDLPLWVFSMAVTGSSVVVVPLAAVAAVLVYGDAAAGTHDRRDEVVPEPR